MTIICIYTGLCIQKAANLLREEHKQNRFCFMPDEWPPFHPKHYTTLALIHHRGRQTDTKVITVTQNLVTEGNIIKPHHFSNMKHHYSRNISELFAPDAMSSVSPNFILIEGAPGIGKTVLSKEMAYQWAEKKILKFKALVFLVFLRDPNLKTIYSLDNLLEYLLKQKDIADLSEHLTQTKGEDLTIIFDGYDELSVKDRTESFVSSIIRRTVLPKCGLVVTSRPTASIHLHGMVDRRVEVLGFTKEDRLDYIQHAFEGSDNKIKKLQFYLQSHSTIDSLCYIPLNMTILLSLFEEVLSTTLIHDVSEEIDALPNTQTELYQNFIWVTIVRFLKKNNVQISSTFIKYFKLPEPYNKMLMELSHLAYFGLQNDTIVFNLREISASYPSLTDNPDGLGLLKAIRFVSTVSFHFLHFSIQEYLAAYFIASMSCSRQTKLLEATFWDIHYFNTWIMYVGITGGRKLALRHYLSGNRFLLFTKLFKTFVISKDLIKDRIKCLHLIQCFAEVGGNKSLDNFLKEQTIDLSKQTLLPKDINTVGYFILRSDNKHWKTLNLSKCNIGDTGCDILLKMLGNQDVIRIDKVDLSHNCLEIHSMLRLIKMFKLWHVSEAVMNEDDDSDKDQFQLLSDEFFQCINEDTPLSLSVNQCYLFAHKADDKTMCTQLLDITNITGLYLNNCTYPSDTNSLNLGKDDIFFNLHIEGGIYCDSFFIAIAKIIKKIWSVFLKNSSLSNETIDNISDVFLHKGPCDIMNKPGGWMVVGSKKILGITNIPYENHSVLNVCDFLTCNANQCCDIHVSPFTLVPSDKTFILSNLLKTIHSNDQGFCIIENNILFANKASCDDIIKLLSSKNCLTYIFIRKCKITMYTDLLDLIKNQKSLLTFYIFESSLCSFFMKMCLDICLKLKEVLIHSVDPLCALPYNLLDSVHSSCSMMLITKDACIGNNPTSEQVSLSLQLAQNATIWKFLNCHANVNILYEISRILSTPVINTVELYISGCNVRKNELETFTHLFRQQQGNCNLEKLTVSKFQFNDQVIEHMITFLCGKSNLKELNLSQNHLQAINSRDIFKIKTIINLTKLDISQNNITDGASSSIASFISLNTNLQELNLSYNSLQISGALEIFKSTENISSWTKFIICNRNDEINNTRLVNDSELVNLSCDFYALCLNKHFNQSLYYFPENSEHTTEVPSDHHEDKTKPTTHDGLRKVNLSYNNFQVADALALLDGMETVDLVLNFWDVATIQTAKEITAFLTHSANLKVLCIKFTHLSTEVSITFVKEKNIYHKCTIKFQSKVSNNQVSSDIASFISHNVNLHELDLSFNSLQTESITRIVEKMHLTNLIKLNISHNGITDHAAKVITNFLSQNSKLEDLDLSYNNLQAAGAIKIAKIINIKSLIKFNISHNEITDYAAESIANFLSRHCKLQELDISFNYLKAAGIVKIVQLSNITDLIKFNISQNGITDYAVESIANFLSQNSKLQELDISYNNLTKVNIIKIVELKGITNLMKFNISHSHNGITDHAAESIANFLSKNSKLEELDLSYNNLQATGAMKIAKLSNILGLIKFNISHNAITDHAAESIAHFLSQNSKLEELDLSHNHLQTAGAIEIAKTSEITKLKKFNISHNSITDHAAEFIASFLSSNSKLEELNLSYNSLQTEGAIRITEVIMSSVTNLIKLNLSHNGITEHAAEFIATFLSKNCKLQELDLSCNNLQAVGIIKFIKSSCITSLIKFNISHNGISNHAAESIANFLYHNYKLEELDISHNDLQAAGAIKIAQLSNITNLTRFTISHNVITDHAAEDIAGFLSQNSKLEEIDLSYNNLKTDGAIKIVKLIIQNITNLLKFNIGHNGINDHAANYIANFLFQNSKLEELNLCHNNLETGGTIKIVELTNITNLIKLSINHNSITDHAAESIACFLSLNPKLEELDLSYNNLQAPGAMKIAQSSNVKNLIKFNISHNAITDHAAESIADFLSRNSKLKELDLSYNNLQAVGANKIVRLSNITYLLKFNISHNAITDYTAKSVGNFLIQNSKLEELDLSHNNLQAAGISKIIELPNITNLKKFNISHNEITDQIAEDIANFLSQNCKLVELDVSYNNLQTEGAIKIARLSEITNLIKFNISHNEVNEQAAKWVASFLSQNSKLKELDLSYNNLQATGAIEIAELCSGTNLTKLKELDLRYNYLQATGAIEIAKLCSVNNLTKFNISHNKITDKAAKSVATFLSQNSKLEELDLSYNNLQSAGAIEIAGLCSISSLIKLNISHNEITGEAANPIATFLSQNSKLQELDLSYNNLQAVVKIEYLRDITNLNKFRISCIGITDQAAKNVANFLSQNSKLEELDLSCNSPGAVKITELCNITNLKKFNISHNGIIDQAGKCLSAFLSKNSNLEELDLSYNKLKATGVNMIAELCKITNLTKLNISHNDITDHPLDFVPTFLSQNLNLKEFDLSHNNLQAEGAINILEWSSITNLVKFSISHNSITDHAAECIAIFIFQNSKLEEIDLSCNNLHAPGAIKIAQLSNINNLVKFNISHNAITNHAAESIADFLSQNSKLEELDLSYNSLQAKGAIKITQSCNITNLVRFNINNNGITDRAAKSIANFLSQNSKLEELSLGYNNLKATGIIKITELRNIRNLTKFNISHNDITDHAAESIAVFLSQNSKLQELDLSNNNLKGAGAIKITELRSIKNLTKFNLSHNGITDHATRSIACFLSNNSKLEELDLSYNNLKVIELAQLHNMIKFNISHNSITDAEGQCIADFLLLNPKIEELNLSYNNLKAAGVMKITQLRKIVNLVKFNISHNGITDHAAESIADFLSQNSKLEELDLSYSNLHTAGAIKIGQLRNITNLVKLNISCNNITDHAAESLAVFLSQNSNLEEINLSYNYLQVEGTIKIAELSNIRHLIKFNISHNGITDNAMAAKCLGVFLFHNSNLKELDLSCNNLQAEGIIMILKWSGIKNLIKINISHNSITDEAAKCVADFLSKNFNLKEVNLSYNKLQAPGIAKFAEMRNRNWVKLNVSNNSITEY